MVGRVLFKLKSVFYWITSAITKKLFKKEVIKKYRYGDEFFFRDREEYNNLLKIYNKKLDNYWKNVNDFCLNDYFSDRYNARKKMLIDSFIPMFSVPPSLIDIGCSAGYWDALIATKCKDIDAYDYSQLSISAAKEKWKDIDNLHFYRSDAKKLTLNRIYDGAMVLGLFMYIEDLEDIYQICQNIAAHMKQGGYLYTSDTVNCEGFDHIYLLNTVSCYNAAYHSQKELIKQIEQAGFELVKECVFDEVKTRRLHFEGIGLIWRRV